MNLFKCLVPILVCLLPAHCRGSGREEKDADVNWRAYQETICLKIFGGEIVLPALGHGRVCGHPTPNCNQAYCGECAARLGVCEVCGKKNNWTKNTDAKTEVPILFAILKHSDNLEARRVAIYALGQIKEPGTLERLMVYARDKTLYLQLAQAVGEFGDKRYADFLGAVLHGAGNDYFGDKDGNIEGQYYIAQAAQASAASLAALGSPKAVAILLRAAKKGRLWERCYALGVLGSIADKRAIIVLHECLDEFFAHNSDWKWIPGRDLIGAALQSLGRVGGRESALRVIKYIKNPGCDFLYTDLMKCLSQIGKPAFEELTETIHDGLKTKPNDYANQIILEALVEIADPRAIPFFIELVNADYSDEYLERDVKCLVLRGLGKVKAAQATDEIARELDHGKEESIRQAAAQALGQIGGERAFGILEDRIRQWDAEWVVRECFAGLVQIAFTELKNDSLKLEVARLYAAKGNYEYAFDVLYQPLAAGEAWGKAYFFEILDHVPMRQKMYLVIDLLNTRDAEVFERTLRFLDQATKLGVKARFVDDDGKKAAARKSFQEWYGANYDKLK